MSITETLDPFFVNRDAFVMRPSKKSLNVAGAKDDSGKVMGSLVGDFGLALLEVAKLGTFGASKYTRGGWKEVPDGVQRYDDAMWRHLLKSATETIDPETNISHEVAVVWNALAKLELKLRLHSK